MHIFAHELLPLIISIMILSLPSHGIFRTKVMFFYHLPIIERVDAILMLLGMKLFKENSTPLPSFSLAEQSWFSFQWFSKMLVTSVDRITNPPIFSQKLELFLS